MQEMGLGKTLSALSLISNHLDQLAESMTPSIQSATKITLIIVPKSSTYEFFDATVHYYFLICDPHY